MSEGNGTVLQIAAETRGRRRSQREFAIVVGSARYSLCLEGSRTSAQQLRDRPADGDVLETVRADGTISRFDRSTGAFLAFNRDGTIRAFFKPNDGERYFQRQTQRAH